MAGLANPIGQALVALPFESMDTPTLSAHLQRIGKL